MDTTVVQSIFGVLAFIGGAILRHYVGPKNSTTSPSHPILDALSAAAKAALKEALEKRVKEEGVSEVKSLLAHLDDKK